MVDQVQNNQDKQPTLEEVSTAHSDNVRERAAAAFLYGSMSTVIGPDVDSAAYQQYRDQLLADAGNPHDPIEIMLVEATFLAFHNVGRLHIKSATAEHHEVAATYAAAATKLAGEHRRLSLAVAEYRAKVTTRLEVVDENDMADSQPTTHRVA